MGEFRLTRLVVLLWLTLIFVGSTERAWGGFEFGGFDLSRGGGLSLADGSMTSALQGDISSTFPGSTLTASSTLTSSYLSTIQILIVSSGTSDNTATTPLSSSEQTALLNFIKAGGGAIILVDNDTFAGTPTSSNANNSFLSPFGLHITGTLNGVQAVNVTNSSHPVTNGPFGPVTGYTTNFPGWFDILGPTAIGLANLASNNQVVLAAINPGTLMAGSGGVVFLGDANAVTDQFSNPSDVRLINNAIAFVGPSLSAVPEPSSLVLGSLALVSVAVFAGVRHRLRFRVA